MMTSTYYLTIHFAPNTECVCVEIPAHAFRRIAEAMDKHAGDITIDTSVHHKSFIRKVGGRDGT